MSYYNNPFLTLNQQQQQQKSNPQINSNTNTATSTTSQSNSYQNYNQHQNYNHQVNNTVQISPFNKPVIQNTSNSIINGYSRIEIRSAEAYGTVDFSNYNYIKGKEKYSDKIFDVTYCSIESKPPYILYSKDELRSYDYKLNKQRILESRRRNNTQLINNNNPLSNMNTQLINNNPLLLHQNTYQNHIQGQSLPLPLPLPNHTNTSKSFFEINSNNIIKPDTNNNFNSILNQNTSFSNVNSNLNQNFMSKIEENSNRDYFLLNQQMNLGYFGNMTYIERDNTNTNTNSKGISKDDVDLCLIDIKGIKKSLFLNENPSFFLKKWEENEKNTKINNENQGNQGNSQGLLCNDINNYKYDHLLYKQMEKAEERFNKERNCLFNKKVTGSNYKFNYFIDLNKRSHQRSELKPVFKEDDLTIEVKHNLLKDFDKIKIQKIDNQNTSLLSENLKSKNEQVNSLKTKEKEYELLTIQEETRSNLTNSKQNQVLNEDLTYEEQDLPYNTGHIKLEVITNQDNSQIIHHEYINLIVEIDISVELLKEGALFKAYNKGILKVLNGNMSIMTDNDNVNEIVNFDMFDISIITKRGEIDNKQTLCLLDYLFYSINNESYMEIIRKQDNSCHERYFNNIPFLIITRKELNISDNTRPAGNHKEYPYENKNNISMSTIGCGDGNFNDDLIENNNKNAFFPCNSLYIFENLQNPYENPSNHINPIDDFTPKCRFYITSPTIEVLSSFPKSELMKIDHFSIENQYGKIEFLSQVDLTYTNIDEIISIHHLSLSVYSNHIIPPCFHKLNVPCRCELYDVVPPSEALYDSDSFNIFLEKMISLLKSSEARFLEYDLSQNLLIFMKECQSPTFEGVV